MRTILKNINKCSRLYDSTTDPIEKQLMLKLALLETAGWIENTFDDLYLTCAKTTESKQRIEKYIDDVSSFGLNKFRTVMSFCVGVNTVISIEATAPKAIFNTFSSAIKEIKDLRDDLAHNHKNATKKYIPFKELKKKVILIKTAVAFIKIRS